MPGSKKLKNLKPICGCTICGFISWIGGCDGTRPEHAEHHWFRETGHATSYGCFDCFNLYTLNRTAATKADRGGHSSECSTPNLRRGISTPFKDLSSSRVTSKATQTSFPPSTSARQALLNHDSVLQNQAALEDYDAIIPDSSPSTPELSDADESQPQYPLTQKIKKEKEKEKEEEKKKEKEKDKKKEEDKKRKDYDDDFDEDNFPITSRIILPERQKKIKFSKV